MGKVLLRDNFDLILLAILEDGPKYGLEIIAEAKGRTNGYFDFKEGSLYPALHRLDKAGWVEAEFAPSNTGGPRRRYYRLTEAGMEQLAEQRDAWERFNGAVGALWRSK
jgi:PadR family transcriptional regulator, regulatory protein PadR